ncbi:MAG: hypothetical protein MUC83_12470 [Pirellula sp.]|nr:hypothetical protein [Pirellula sp.]
MTNSDGTIIDSVLGTLNPPNDWDSFEYTCQLRFLGSDEVSLRISQSDQLSSELSYLRTVVGAIRVHDHHYRQFAAKDVWVFHRYMFKGPTLSSKDLASKLKLSWIQPVLSVDPNLGVNVWYNCQNLIPNARVCVTLDHKARFYSAGIG